MKIRLVVALVGLAISFALPTFAQQKETVDPQLIQKLYDTISKKWNEACNNHDAAAIAALYTEDAIDVTATEDRLRSAGHRELLRRHVQGVATQKPYQHDRSAFCPHVRARQFNAQWRMERDW